MLSALTLCRLGGGSAGGRGDRAELDVGGLAAGTDVVVLEGVVDESATGRCALAGLVAGFEWDGLREGGGGGGGIFVEEVDKELMPCRRSR